MPGPVPEERTWSKDPCRLPQVSPPDTSIFSTRANQICLIQLPCKANYACSTPVILIAMTFKAYPPLKRDAQSWACEANVTTCPQTPAIWLLTSSKPQVPEILYILHFTKRPCSTCTCGWRSRWWWGVPRDPRQCWCVLIYLEKLHLSGEE